MSRLDQSDRNTISFNIENYMCPVLTGMNYWLVEPLDLLLQSHGVAIIQGSAKYFHAIKANCQASSDIAHFSMSPHGPISPSSPIPSLLPRPRSNFLLSSTALLHTVHRRNPVSVNMSTSLRLGHTQMMMVLVNEYPSMCLWFSCWNINILFLDLSLLHKNIARIANAVQCHN